MEISFLKMKDFPWVIIFFALGGSLMHDGIKIITKILHIFSSLIGNTPWNFGPVASPGRNCDHTSSANFPSNYCNNKISDVKGQVIPHSQPNGHNISCWFFFPRNLVPQFCFGDPSPKKTGYTSLSGDFLPSQLVIPVFLGSFLPVNWLCKSLWGFPSQVVVPVFLGSLSPANWLHQTFWRVLSTCGT